MLIDQQALGFLWALWPDSKPPMPPLFPSPNKQSFHGDEDEIDDEIIDGKWQHVVRGDYDYNDDYNPDDDDDIYIMMKCMCVCLSRFCLFCLPLAKLMIYI